MYASKTIGSVAFVLAALAVGPVATAQVAIEMTTTQQAHCLATTDAAGLRLVPGGTSLEATGVVLAGEGCQVQGGSAADFETTVTVQPAATVPATVNVQWSASDDAEQCTFGGTGPAASGWPVGTTACQGAACAGSHVTPVSLAAAGSYGFSVTCTNATGFATGALTATGGGTDIPPSPANFALTAPATGSTQTPFQVSWTVTGATSCTGSASMGGNSINLTGWTTVTTPTSPRNATATVAGTYELRLTCSNAFGSVSSQPKSITITQGDSCPANRLTVGTIGYPPLTAQSVYRQNADLTNWDTIWGHTTPTDAVVPWPGIAGTSPVIMSMGRTQYIAAKFRVPAGTPSTWTGFYKNVSNYGGLNITTSISEVCGDFAPAQAGCLKENIPPSDSTTLYWRMQNPTNFHCALVAGRDYYLNIKNTDPTQANGNCPSGSPTCKVHVLNNATTN